MVFFHLALLLTKELILQQMKNSDELTVIYHFVLFTVALSLEIGQCNSYFVLLFMIVLALLDSWHFHVNL